MCAGLTLKWLQEKLGGSNRLFHRSHKEFVKNSSVERKEALALSAGRAQLDYIESGSQIEKTYAKNYMVASELAGSLKKIKGPHPNYASITDMASSFEQVCSQIKPGTGVVMRTTLTTSTGKKEYHATGLYKSRGKHLHFFDPNVGIYEVKNPAEFVSAWVSSYASHDRVVSMDRKKDGFFQCAPTDTLIQKFREGESCVSISPPRPRASIDSNVADHAHEPVE